MATVKCIQCAAVLSNSAGAFAPVYLRECGATAFVCAHCDYTHLTIISANPDFCISVTLTAEAAEMLAAELINPRPDPFGVNPRKEPTP